MGNRHARTRNGVIRIVIVGAFLSLVAATGVTPSAFAKPPDDPVVAQGNNWEVRHVPGGYAVTYQLDEPLEVRAAAPTLVVDGHDVGVARESADGLSLTVLTTDPDIANAKKVSTGWDGDAPAARATGQAATTTSSTPSTPVADDPATPGDYKVGRADYDLGTQAIDLAEIGGIKGELRAAVYYPKVKSTPSPVVVFLHGRHTSCSGGTANPNRYPCGPNQTEIPSYLGYTAPAEALASHGYVVVSVSANAINANDNQLAADYGATARGQLVLDHLDLLAKANDGTADGVSRDLKGRLDLTQVGLMGHSRGGEGVVRAAQLNAARALPYNIVSVLPLAPVDFGRLTLPAVPTLTVLPYCDGDVVNLQGQHFFDDSRDAFDDDVLRSTALVMGANHNFFNTVWTPGLYQLATSDDWAAQDRNQTNAWCGQNSSERLTAAEQYAVGTAYVAAWFRLTMAGEEGYLPLFDGTGGTAVSAGRAQVETVASVPAGSRADVAGLTQPSTSVRVSGSATVTYCASMSGAPYPYQTPVCSSTLTSSQAPHWTQMRFAPSAPATPLAKFSWTAGTGQLRVDVPAKARDLSRYDALTFRASPDALATEPVDLTVTVTDGQGKSASVPVSSVSTALAPLPGTASPLLKTILRQVRIPVTALTGIDMKDVRRVAFQGAGDQGTALLSDVAFSTSAVGKAKVDGLPLLSVTDETVNEGSGPGEALIGIKLSKRSTVPVTAYLEAIASGAGERIASQVIIPAGKTCVAYSLPIVGNRLASATASTRYSVTAAVVTRAASARTFGSLTIREDDAVVTSDGTVGDLDPDPGVQKDPCKDADQPLPVATRTVVGSAVKVTAGTPAVVEATVVPLSADAASPTGTVTLSERGSTLAVAAVDPRGTAVAGVKGLSVGTHVLAVTYGGAPGFEPSSTTIQVVVSQAPKPSPSPSPSPSPTPPPATSPGLAPSPAGVVSRVKLGQSQLRLVKGKSFSLNSAVYYADKAARPAFSGKVTWKSSDTKVATVSSTGTIKAKSKGKATITATTTQLNAAGKKLSTSVKVAVVKSRSKAKVKKVSATVPKTLTRGQVAYVTGKYSPAKATGVKVTYSTSKPAVVTVDKAGRVVALAKGTAQVKVKAGGKTRSYKITIT